MKKRITKQLVIDALDMAIKNRAPGKGLILHSDRGSQNAGHEFQRKLLENGFRSSMSCKGDCWDNAVAESLFATLKTELIYDNKFLNRKQTRQDIF